MSNPQPLPESIASRPPFVVWICSAGVALLGCIVSIAWLLMVVRNSAIEITGPLLATRFDDVIWLIYGVLYGFFVAAASTVAAREYWHRRRRGLVVQLLAILLFFPAVSFALVGVALIAISLAILAAMAAYLKTSRAVAITALGVALALATFFYQRMGPSVGKYGTECIPIEDCTARLLGAGYPIQYFVNQPGITSPVSLGSEDEFRLLPFALDILAFVAVAYLGSTAILLTRSKLRSPEGGTTDLTNPPGAQPAVEQREGAPSATLRRSSTDPGQPGVWFGARLGLPGRAAHLEAVRPL